jgi:ribosome-binding factor A
LANPRTIARLEARIKERAAYCLEFEVSDPRAAFITLTGVKLTKDLSHARVSYSVLGDDADKSRAKHMLESAAGFIQRQVGRVLQVRRVPRLSFEYDDSIEHAAHMETVIREALERDRRIAAEREAAEAAETSPGAPDPDAG